VNRVFTVKRAFLRFAYWRPSAFTSERGEQLWCYLLLLYAKLGIHYLPTQELLRLGANAADRANDIAYVLCVRRGLRGISAASRHLHMPNCLVQAVALRVFLSQRGIAAHLHVGVRRAEVSTRNDASILGHAWLTARGEVLIGGNHLHPHYVEFRQSR
jgi:hypothetical protein